MFKVLHHILRLRDLDPGVIPAVCFDDCNDAYLVAQDTGKTPGLCASDSSFYYYYNNCMTCVQKHAADDMTSVSPAFGQYISFCNSTEATPTGTIPMSWLTWSGAFVPTTISGTGINGPALTTTVLYNSVNITSTLPAYFFHVSASSLISNFVPKNVFSDLAISVASAAWAASVTGAGDPTSLIYSVLEDTSLPPWFQAAVPATYSTQIATLEAQINNLRADSLASTTPLSSPSNPTTVGPTSSMINETTSSSPTNTAWIAGVVVGPVVGLALILLGLYLLRRHRLRKRPMAHDSENKTSGKPELHAESLPAPRIYEMDGMQNSMELEVNEAPQELPAEGPSNKVT